MAMGEAILPEDAEYPAIGEIAELCLARFNGLPRTGKPLANEWTVLAGVVQLSASTDERQVVALGLGTKCIGRSKLCPRGLILNDSHAEVLARRSLLRYFYHELRIAASSPAGGSVFVWDPQQGVFRLRPGVTFHFFCTQTPCGDACITQPDSEDYDKDHDKDDDDDELAIPEKKPKLSGGEDSLLPASESEQVFTGAKLIAHGEEEDCLQQTVGALRTKPGRGDRTLSMSCSDKLSKWNVLGVQGALLDALLDQPIYFKTLNFCSSVPPRQATLKRAIYERWLGAARHWDVARFEPQQPQIRTSSQAIQFEFEQQADKQPSPNGLAWCAVPEQFKPYEVSVNGKRQGATTKMLSTPRAALRVSKYYLRKEFTELLSAAPQLLQNFQVQEALLPEMPYHELKQLAQGYQLAWSEVKRSYFRHWTHKPPGLMHFNDDYNHNQTQAHTRTHAHVPDHVPAMSNTNATQR